MPTRRQLNKTASRVSFAVFDTAWGSAGLSWTPNGLCGLVLPGLAPDHAAAEIRALYPDARQGDRGEVKNHLEAIKRYFEGKAAALSAEIDFYWATPFQKKVFRALMKVPYGTTVSYAQLARRIGSPAAARAIGQANAANRVPLFIPCHRVVAADGSPGGFSGPGGVMFKLRLLELESGDKQPR